MNQKISLLKSFGVVIQAGHKDAGLNEIDIEFLRELFRSHQLVLFRGFKSFRSTNEFIDYCERWGVISLWPFGKVLELVEHDHPEDHIFDNSYVPMHWDGMYRPEVPEYQIFRCVRAPRSGQGGRTTFANTLMALKSATAEERELWQKATGSYRRQMEFYKSQTVSPIVTEHPYRGYPVIRYNEPPSNEMGRFLNPPEIEFSGIEPDELPRLHQSLKNALYHPNHFYAHEWQAGDIVIADNLSLLHGREKFLSGSPRHLQRVHVLGDPPYANPALRDYKC